MNTRNIRDLCQIAWAGIPFTIGWYYGFPHTFLKGDPRALELTGLCAVLAIGSQCLYLLVQRHDRAKQAALDEETDYPIAYGRQITDGEIAVLDAWRLHGHGAMHTQTFPRIKERMLANARKAFAPWTEAELPIALRDSDVLFHTGKVGLVLTTTTIYWKSEKTSGRRLYLDIDAAAVRAEPEAIGVAALRLDENTRILLSGDIASVGRIADFLRVAAGRASGDPSAQQESLCHS